MEHGTTNYNYNLSNELRKSRYAQCLEGGRDRLAPFEAEDLAQVQQLLYKNYRKDPIMFESAPT